MKRSCRVLCPGGKWLEFMWRTRRFLQREEALRRLRSFVLHLIVVIVCHGASVRRTTRRKTDRIPFSKLRVKSLSYLMLTQSEHAVESNPRVVSSAFVNRDTVHDVALAEIFERPEEMLRGDAEHRRANANAGVE